MSAVTQVAKPSLQGCRVVFVDEFAVGRDGGGAGDGGPFAGGVEEGDVDGGVGGEIVSFAGFGVGVEEEVDAARFLCVVSVGKVEGVGWRWKEWLEQNWVYINGGGVVDGNEGRAYLSS